MLSLFKSANLFSNYLIDFVIVSPISSINLNLFKIKYFEEGNQKSLFV